MNVTMEQHAGPASCHPGRRKARADGLCFECMQDDRARRRGRIRVVVDGVARRIPGVLQRALTDVPARCPKCRCPHLRLEGREIHCPGHFGGCGGIWVLVTA